MNTLCMKISGNRRAVDSKNRRKKVLRGLKALERRIAGHARARLGTLRTRHEETNLTAGEVKVIIQRMEGVLKHLPAAFKQAYERIIGERQVPRDVAEVAKRLYEKPRFHVGLKRRANSTLLTQPCPPIALRSRRIWSPS